MQNLLRYFLFGVCFLIIYTSCSTTRDSTVPYTIYPTKPAPDHSGMWLLPQITGAVHDTLTRRGVALAPSDFYSRQSPSLNQAIVRINIGESGGGTGSFVSDQGLILTNHHVAYDAITAASTPDTNYLSNGFYAGELEDELPVFDYTLYIPIEQTEVTDKINGEIDDNLTNLEKAEKKEQLIEVLIRERQSGNPDLVVEIDDYWSGNRQFMVTYRVIRDVRLVYAPRESIGKFGGDIDNWMWPRHTGDFTFLRAYVSPDGSSESYQPNNVPYVPDYSLAVRAGNLHPGDATLTLGFPGTTYRFESSYAFEFYENQQFPALQKTFQAYLKGLELKASGDSSIAVELAAERASIANALKYYEGVRSGFDTHHITRRKKEQDREFDRWVWSDSLRSQTYGQVLPQLEQSYRIAGQMGDLLFMSFYTIQFSSIVQMGPLFDEFYEYTREPDSLFFSLRERQQLFDQVRLWHETTQTAPEQLIATELLKAFAELPEERRPLTFYRFFETGSESGLKDEIERFMERQKSHSALLNRQIAQNWIYEKTGTFTDSLYLVTREIHDILEQSQQNYVQHFSYLNPAQKLYSRGMLEMNPSPTAYPDANFTLRLSSGKIAGYRPADGLYALPFTTYEGLLAKYTGQEPFDIPRTLREYSGSFDGYQTPDGNLILNLLSTNDITGGNSGSPLLNGSGELIGVAFDGNIEGIVSDFFVVPETSRTISVDIRYILFLMDQIDRTTRLLEEMEIRRN